MRTLIINSMFVNAIYRRCADEIGKLPGVDLTMLTTNGWRMNGGVMPLDPVSVGAPYRMVVGKAGWKGKENRGFYLSGVAKAMRQTKPEVIFLMEEPFSLFAFEVLSLKQVLAPQAAVVFFTWNNLSLEDFDYRPSIAYHSISNWTLPRLDSALTANESGVDVLRRSGFTGPVKRIGYGVDVDRFLSSEVSETKAVRDSLSIDESDRVIGYVGRLIPMKGVDLLISAFANLVRRTPGLKLLLLGGGESERELLAQASRLGIDHAVRHVKTVPPHQVPAYVKALDYLVLPSRRQGMWEEQFGRVLVEAMAAGKIVIGSSSGAIPEVIGSAGFVFTEDDAQDLEAKIRRALSLSSEDDARLRQTARERAVNEFSWERFARIAADTLREAHSRKLAHR